MIFNNRSCADLLLALSFLVLLASTCGQPESREVTVYSDTLSAPVQFAVDHLEQALRARGYRVQQSPLQTPEEDSDNLQIILFASGRDNLEQAMRNATGGDASDLIPEGFSLQKSSGDTPTYWVRGYDEGGVLYGGLELAEQIRVYGPDAVQPATKNPYMEMRGTKFNIPLDARTPSYTDMSDAGQKNMAVVWDFGFWTEYLDHLALHRYNFVSLWNLHPFPSMVKVPDYPDVALDDVKRSTVAWDEYYSLQGRGFDAPEIMDHLETIKEISIDEKIAFWRDVMQYAADRNIDFYVVTWNIFVNGTEGKYGITDAIDNPTTIDYFRKSVKELFMTYPLLAGIGLTTGENMPEAGFDEKEEWAYQTYGLGVLDAAEALPDRQITLIHRQHQTGTQDIADRFRAILDRDNVDFIFSFKYAQAHVYSSTTQHFHHDFVEDIGDMKTIWTLRNDDVYQFRWGAPDFVRSFIKNIPYDVGRGYYYGSDQYIWGREFLSLNPQSPRELEVGKHWYQWMMWGRLGYDPDLGNDRFIAILQDRFPETEAATLFTAWQEASMIYPIVTGFHWGEFDFQWYIEACKSRPEPAQTASGFHDVNRFITLPPHRSTDYLSIPEYVEAITNDRPTTGTTPLAVAARLHDHTDQAMTLLESLEDGGNETLQRTLRDIRTVAFLGKYYAHKIHGATALALFRASGENEHQQDAVNQLTQAAAYWRQYTNAASAQYANPFWTNRVGYVDWERLTREVQHDITIAEQAEPSRMQ